jgi:hypothetical protein
MAPSRPSERDNRECSAGPDEIAHAPQGLPGVGEVMKGCVGYHRVEPAEAVAGIEDVSVPPGDLSAGESLLGSLQNRLIDVHSDDMRYSLRQPSS